MKKSLLVTMFTVCSIASTLVARSIQSELTLTKNARIYVLTCSSGAELYSVFGHSAVRIVDRDNVLGVVDYVFNWGTFDFGTEHFYLKYAQGLLPYQLSVSSYEYFLNSYMLDNRAVFSQELHLDPFDRQKLADAILENYKPENRTYLYNFLFDNCSSRIRDIINNSHSETIVWNGPELDKSFWNLLDECLMRLPWVKWGIHTILGQGGTQKATPYQYMFLPDYLMAGLSTATVEGLPLVGDITTVVKVENDEINHHWYFSPFFVFTLVVLILIGSMQTFKSEKLLRSVAIPMFLISGLLGCLMVFLGYFTQHPITAPNLNLIWANPVNLAVLPFLFRKKISKVVTKYYFKFYIAILLIGIPIWFTSMPATPIESLLIIVLMLYLSIKLGIENFQWILMHRTK
ncbi:membrane protein [Bacteroidia bacterium]|nr:membrane protein [Bacteroidia bacterium]